VQLVDFIRHHHEAILSEWESFAGTLVPGAEGMSHSALRDHAGVILNALVEDMESQQSVAEEVAKSKGGRPAGRLGQLGELHAALRLAHGFTLSQMLAEYRALRASVLRLWGRKHSDPDGVLRFNEAIDEALTEAATAYAVATNEYRDQVLGIVSHDLRNPLGAVLAGASVLLGSATLDDKSARVAAKIENSARRMARIVSDLLDLTHARLGTEIPVVPRPTDLGLTCEAAIAELEATHSSAEIRYTANGDLRGEWDSDRLAQVVSNLVANALQHGDADKPITVNLQDAGKEVAVSVHNEGPPIPEGALNRIFEPLTRYASGSSERTARGLGLGLYIVKQLVIAHGGTVGATSTRSHGTTFSVRLPRRRGERLDLTDGTARDANETATVPKRQGRSPGRARSRARPRRSSA
jgi:signal transduction histidine kinase